MLNYGNIQDIYQLSPLQKGIYFHALYDSASLAYFEQLTFNLTGKLSVPCIRKSIDTLYERHEVLRTVFNLEKKDIPLQVVLKKVDWSFHFEDISHLETEAEKDAHIRTFKAADKQRSFNLGKDVLMRVALFQTAVSDFELIWTYHHIILDGWGTNILIFEFFELYNSFLEQRPSRLPAARSYRSYINWLEKLDAKASGNYWKNYLHNYNEAAFLPATCFDNKNGYNLASHVCTLEIALQERLEKMVHKCNVTLNTIFQSVWGILLSRYNQCRDVVFGTVVSGRPPELEGAESILGLFVNTIPVRVTYNEQMSFIDLLREMHLAATSSQEHAYSSLAEIQEATGLKQSLIDHLYGFQNYKKLTANEVNESAADNNREGIITGVKAQEAFTQTNYDFNIKFLPGDQIRISFEFNANVYSSDLIRKFERDIIAIIDQITTTEDIVVDQIALSDLTGAEAALLSALNDTKTDYPATENIVSIFRKQVLLQPSHPAVICGDQSLTYDELDRLSNKIANFLLTLQVQRESVVAIYQRKSVHLIASILGILKAGAAYLPVNLEYTKEQVAGILQEADVHIVISETEFLRDLHKLQWICDPLDSFMCIDSDELQVLVEPESRLMSRELWEYIGGTAVDHIEGGGWVNSYTGEHFSAEEMEEYGTNIYSKLLPYLGPDKKVLEIGCASGITMFQVAPHVHTYFGTDISQPVLDYDARICSERNITNIRLARLGAHEINQLEENDFDIIILNSVVQCFSGHNYFRKVIGNALELLGENGVIFLGDIMDQAKEQHLVASIREYKTTQQSFKGKLDFSEELFIDRRFLDDLMIDFPVIKAISYSSKNHTLENELTRFRYDAVISVDKSHHNGQTKRNRYQYDAGTLRSMSEECPGIIISPHQLSNIIFTSGSTGRPKGILIEHRGLVRLVMNTNFMKVDKADVWAQTVDVAFDPSTLEIFGALLNGAVLCLVPRDILLRTEDFAALLSAQGVTMTVIITPLFHEFAASNPEIFKGLHTIIIGGESLNTRAVNSVLAACPGLKIINAYGPTENSVMSTALIIEESLEQMTIGKPVANSEVYVLDGHRRILPAGVAGEIGVAGDGLARGYLNEPLLTAERFIPHPLKTEKRLYRTGDKGMLLHDGNVLFLGRLDDQVKVRGYRVEPAEIEKALASIPEVENAVVILLEKELGAFVKMRQHVEPAVLKEIASLLLPSYMVPDSFIYIDQFPLTAIGKIDRKSLRNGLFSGHRSKRHDLIAPRNEQESKLLSIWSTVLGHTDISIRDNFFESGGHSLKAMQVVSRISREFNIKTNLATFFAHPTIEELAGVVIKLEKQSFEEIVPIPLADHYATSHAQKRLWILNQYEENQVAYNISGAYRFTGLDKDVFTRTMNTIVDRHESLRTTFITVDGEPRQKIHAAVDTLVSFIDLSQQDNADLMAGKIADEEATTPFDLEKGPLVRMKLLYLNKDSFIFIFTMHHIISDGWSMRLLMEEVPVIYDAFLHEKENPLAPLRIQYKDFVYWQRRLIDEKDEKYWLNYLSGEMNWIRLPVDYTDVGYHTFRGAEENISLSAEQKAVLEEIAANNHTSLSNVMLTIFNILLYNISGQNDLVTGIAVANRNHHDIEKMVGFFVNTLILRTHVNEETDFEMLLKTVTADVIAGFDHQNYPFDLLVEKLNPNRISNKQPIFNVLYGFQNFTDITLDVGRKDSLLQPGNRQSVEVFRQGFATSKFDLTLYVYVWEQTISLSFEYNAALFSQEAVRRWLNYFRKFVNMIQTEILATV